MDVAVENFDAQKISTRVSFYATPLALLLGVMGIAVSDYDNSLRGLCLGALVFSVLFNFVFPRLLKAVAMKKRTGAVHARMAVNLFVNAFLVFALGETYRPMWLILAISPFAAAIHGTRQKIMETAATASLVLVTIQILRGDKSFHGWAEQIGCIAFIVLISLLINGMARLRE